MPTDDCHRIVGMMVIPGWDDGRSHCTRSRMRHPTHAQQVGWVLFLTVLVVLALFRWLYGE